MERGGGSRCVAQAGEAQRPCEEAHAAMHAAVEAHAETERLRIATASHHGATSTPSKAEMLGPSTRFIDEAEVAIREREVALARWQGEARVEVRADVGERESRERARRLFQEQTKAAGTGLRSGKSAG